MAFHLSLIYTTFPHEEEALRVTHELLDRRLIACANILGPLTSVYSWKGKIEKSQEVAVLLKTTPEKVKELMEILQDLHSYDTPAILEIPVGRVLLPFANGFIKKYGKMIPLSFYEKKLDRGRGCV